MIALVAGLVLFLGIHSVRVFADGFREAAIGRIGRGAWRGVYALGSIVGLSLLAVGWGQTRVEAVTLYVPPDWTRHLAALLTVPAFVLLAAAYVPGTRIKRAVGHPMVLGTKLWAFAHLLANGRLGDVILFGAFTAWAVVLYAASRRRDRRAGVTYPAGPIARDVIAVAVGLVLWVGFAFGLHGRLIGVEPFGA